MKRLSAELPSPAKALPKPRKPRKSTKVRSVRKPAKIANWVGLNPTSGNKKVGPIPVSTSDSSTCPTACPLLGTDCYARFGPLGMHWRKVSSGERGGNWAAFCNRVKRFPLGQLWRHNQAGDLPQSKAGKIAKGLLRKLAAASRHAKGWTYTHYSMQSKHNRDIVQEVNAAGGLTINLSANSLLHAEKLHSLGIGPVVCIIPKDAPDRGNTTPHGLPIVVCPAQTTEGMTCEKCKLCTVASRKSIVGFKAHGTAGKRLSKKVLAEIG